MNQIKLLVAIMLAVSIMHVRASDRASQLRAQLVVAVENFQLNTLEQDLGWERFYNLTAYCCKRDREEKLENFSDQLTDLINPLKEDDLKALLHGKNDTSELVNEYSAAAARHQLKDIAKSIKWFLPNPYWNVDNNEYTSEYQSVVRACDEIIALKN